MKLNNRVIDNISLIQISKTRICFDFQSSTNGRYTIFAIDSHNYDGVNIHRWIYSISPIFDTEFNDNKYMCKIIGVDEI